MVSSWTKTRKGPTAAARPVGEAGGARRDGDDLNYKNHLAYPSNSPALGYRAEAWRVSPIDGFASLAKWRTPAEVRAINSGTRADEERQNKQQQ